MSLPLQLKDEDYITGLKNKIQIIIVYKRSTSLAIFHTDWK
jgi:hypothetical protein